MKNTSIALSLLIALVLTACTEREEPQLQSMVSSQSYTLAINQVIGQARIEPEGKIANLSTPVAGIVKTVLKQENDSVNTGDVIVLLEHTIEQARLSRVKSRIRTQLAKIQSQEFEVAEIQTRLTNKEKEFNRLSALLTKGSETQQKVDDVETELNVLRSSAQRSVANLEVAKAELTEIQKEKELAQAELDQRMIKAPAAGILISMSATPGSSLDTQTGFAEFAPHGKWIARAEVDELFANQIHVGQHADIRLVGNEETITTGKVIYAASSLKRKSLFSEVAGDQEDRRVREVKVQLDEANSFLINTRVEVIIKTDK